MAGVDGQVLGGRQPVLQLADEGQDAAPAARLGHLLRELVEAHQQLGGPLQGTQVLPWTSSSLRTSTFIAFTSGADAQYCV